MESLRGLLDHLLPDDAPDTPCRCEPDATDEVLEVDATDCPGGGKLSTEAPCRRTVVATLRRTPRDRIRVAAQGCDRWYTPATSRLLASAARFAERVVHHDERMADLAMRDPVAAATEAGARAGPVGALAESSGLTGAATDCTDVESAIRAYEGPSIASARVTTSPPQTARLRETYETETTTVRIYDSSSQPVPTYHVDPLETGFTSRQYAILESAAAQLASDAGGGENAHHAAVRTVVPPAHHRDHPVDSLAHVLWKHTAGFGVLEDLFADPAVGDVYVNAPPDETVLRVTVDDEPMRTNVCLTAAGGATLAARIRAESGRPFSRVAPLVDAIATDVGSTARIRVAGVTNPVTDGTAFAFRSVDDAVWRLPDLVANGTLTPEAAAFLGLAVERGRRILVAGPRGAGKTTLLAALLWELPPTDRVVLLEDTPELPVDDLQAAGRDALGLRTRLDEDGAAVSPADALRAALRLGDGALVVGEVRGEEAAVLYEAMRVGANSSAVLGTIHGDGGESVEERVVSDLGVPRSSFAATDLVVTVGHTPEGRRLVGIEEVTEDGFATLYELTAQGLVATDRIHRGNSQLVARLASPTETYADVRERLVQRRDSLVETMPTPAPTTTAGDGAA